MLVIVTGLTNRGCCLWLGSGWRTTELSLTVAWKLSSPKTHSTSTSAAQTLSVKWSSRFHSAFCRDRYLFGYHKLRAEHCWTFKFGLPHTGHCVTGTRNKFNMPSSIPSLPLSSIFTLWVACTPILHLSGGFCLSDCSHVSRAIARFFCLSVF